jgi:hypothetical protein
MAHDKSHNLMGYAELLTGVLGILLVMKQNIPFAVIMYALMFLAMGIQHVQSKR